MHSRILLDGERPEKTELDVVKYKNVVSLAKRKIFLT
jgi:hypothetical protein